MDTRRLHNKETALKKYPKSLKSKSTNGIIYLQFNSLAYQDHLSHGIFTRLGGVSDPPYDSLNAAYNIGDQPEKVKKNLKIISEIIDARHLIYMNQVHGEDIIILRKDDHPHLDSIAYADAIITDIPCIALMIKQADCQGVILYDPIKGVLAVAHCGWRGNTHNILGSVVSRMRSKFGCEESNILAAIGPSLGPCCAEFISYNRIFPEWFNQFILRDNHFDLWEISLRQLLDAGIEKEKIEIAGICTRCNTDQFYSYRAEGITGRFATVAMLR